MISFLGAPYNVLAFSIAHHHAVHIACLNWIFIIFHHLSFRLPANYLPSLFLSIVLVGGSFFPTYAEEIFVYYSACTVTQWKIKMQTIQYRRTRIWEMKKDKYTKTLAKNQVCEIFQMRDIGKNGLPKFIKLCMETPCWCPFQEHQYGRRIPTETSVFEFSY